MNDWSQILIDNFKCKEDSFIWYLHEESIFDEKGFWDYYNTIVSITKRTKEQPLDREISAMINYTYNYILESFLWHFAPNDSYEIEKLPKDNLNLYVERLRFAVDGYFSGHVTGEGCFGNELKNPILLADKI